MRKYHHRAVLLLFTGISFAILMSCGNRKEEQALSPDEAGNPSRYEEGMIFPGNHLPNQLSAWLSFYQSKDTAFNLDQFRSSGVALHFGPLPEATAGDFSMKKAFFPLLAFSPDSSLVIDGYSYNHLLQVDKDGNKTIVDGEADQEVSIIQIRTGISRQLMFNGPGLSMEAAGWVNPSAFMLATMETDPVNGRIRPEMLLFNLKDSTFTNFRCSKDFPDTIASGPGGSFSRFWLNKQQDKWKRSLP